MEGGIPEKGIMTQEKIFHPISGNEKAILELF